MVWKLWGCTPNGAGCTPSTCTRSLGPLPTKHTLCRRCLVPPPNVRLVLRPHPATTRRFDDAFCDEAVELYTEAGAINNIFYCLGYDYDAVYPGASVLLLGMVNKLGLEVCGRCRGVIWGRDEEGLCAVNPAHHPLPLQVESLTKKHLEEYVLKTWEDKSSKCPKQSYANVCYTPKGLAYYSDWGTLRNTGAHRLDDQQLHLHFAAAMALQPPPHLPP